jgi:hypothetical protein
VKTSIFIATASILAGCQASPAVRGPQSPARETDTSAKEPKQPETPAAANPSRGDEAIKVWSAYRECLVTRDGVRGLALVTPGTVNEYERQLKLTLTLNREQLLQADVLDRYIVLMLRARVPHAQLRTMTGSDLFRLAVDNGWVGSNLPASVKLKRIEGNLAYITFVKDGEEIPGEFPLLKFTDAHWAVDIVELLRLTRPVFLSLFSDIAEKRSTDVNGAMLWTIAKLVGQAPADSIWDAPP